MKPSVSIMLRWSAKALANDRVWLTHKKDLCLKANSITKSDPSIDSAYYIQFHLVFNICLYSKLLKIEPRASWESPKTAVAYLMLILNIWGRPHHLMYQTCLIIRAALSGSVGLAVILWFNQEVTVYCLRRKVLSVISTLSGSLRIIWQQEGRTACVHICRTMDSVNPNGDGTFGFSELVIKFGSKEISTTSNESWAWLHFVKTVACHCSYGISAKNGDSCLHYYVPLKGLSVDISQFL